MPDIRQIVHQTVVLLTILTLVLCIGFPVLARHLFFIAFGLALLAWLYFRGRLPAGAWTVLLPVLLFGLFRVGYTLAETGTLHPKLDAWQVYLATGNRLICGTVLAGYLITEPYRPSLKTLAFALFGALQLCLLQVLYATFFLGTERGSFANMYPTALSYEVVPAYLVFLGCCLVVNLTQWRKWLFVIATSLAAVIIVMITETRAAILALVVLVPALCLLARRQHKWKTLGSMAMILLVVFGAGYPFFIKPRIDNLTKDMAGYVSGENRQQSVGARLEMWRASLLVFRSAPVLGAGLMGRQAEIQRLVTLQELDPITVHFATIHMHNEYLEEASLHGAVGLLLLLWMYGALLRKAMSSDANGERHLPLLGLVTGYAFLGLTDVLFFNREGTIVFVVLLALCLTQREILVTHRLR